MVRAVCSRSQGQSRRSRSVSCCSSSSASPSVKCSAGGGRRAGRARRLLAGVLAGRRGVALRVPDLLAVRLLDAGQPLVHLLLLVLGEELLADGFLHLRVGRRLRGRAGLDRPERLDDVPAELRVHGLRDLVGRDREGDLLELGHEPALDRGARRQLAAVLGRRSVGRVLLRELRELARVLLQLRVEVVGLRLRLHEDVTDVAALGLRRRLVLLLVLVVVGLDVVVADLDVLRDLFEDLLADELELDPLAHFLVAEALLLQRVLVALVHLRRRRLLLAGRVAVVLLLDLLQSRVDVLVADLGVEVVGLLLVLAALDQELRGVGLEIGEVDRARLRELSVRRLEVPAGLLDQRVPVGLRDLLVADDRDRIVGYVLRAAAATGGSQQRNGRTECNQNDPLSHGKSAGSRGFAQAARRAPSIASTRRTPEENSSDLKETSRRALVYTAVSTSARSARSSPEPSSSGPTVVLPPLKTR